MILVAKAIGLNTDQQAAQALYSPREDGDSFLAVLSLTSDDAFTRGRQLLLDLSDLYFDEEGTVSEKLEKTFKQGVEKLKDVESFDLGVAVISGKVLYLLVQGKIKVMLNREGSTSPLLEEGSGQLISGFLKESDRVLFATESLINFLGSDLKNSLRLNLSDWEEEISARVAGREPEAETSDGIAGLLLEVEAEGEIKTIEPEIKEVHFKNPVKIDFRQILTRIAPSKKGKLILAIILLLVIILGVGLQFKKAKDEEREAEFNKLMQSARSDLNTAFGLQTLNPDEASKKIASSRDSVLKALSLKPYDEGATNLKKQIEEAGNLGKTSANFDLFLDLNLIKSGFSTERLSLSGTKLLVLDSSGDSLVLIDLDKKSNQVLAGRDSLGDTSFASLNGNLAFVYSDKGVMLVDAGNKKTTTVSKVDKDWGQIIDLYGFGGNVYLLDSGANQIWKYLPTSEGFSDKREYLSKDTKANFSAAVRLQIESSIYILKSSGEILRFTRGVADHFGISGLDKGIKSPKSFFISSETENLYLLDSGNSRLLVLGRTGEYKAQYLGDKFASASDLVVDEVSKKVYLLENGKIYTMDLK